MRANLLKQIRKKIDYKFVKYESQNTYLDKVNHLLYIYKDGSYTSKIINGKTHFTYGNSTFEQKITDEKLVFVATYLHSFLFLSNTLKNLILKKQTAYDIRERRNSFDRVMSEL